MRLPAQSDESVGRRPYTAAISDDGMRSILSLAAILLSVAISVLAQTQMATSGTNLDSNGWTTFTPSAGARIIYVSSSAGNNRNNGLSPKSPLASIAKGLTLLRNGSDDQLLLKAGDTWHESMVLPDVAGTSASHPILISSYGTGARPVIDSGSKAGLDVYSPTFHTDNIAVVGLNFYAGTRDPNSPEYVPGGAGNVGITWAANGTNLLFENCEVQYYIDNISMDETNPGFSLNNVTFRRDVIANAYSTVGGSQGIFTSGINGLVFEENIFDHNGWNASIPGANATVFNRNIYLRYTNGPVYFQDNISTNSSSEGAQFRSGGTVLDNLFVKDSSGFDLGHLQGDPIITTANVQQNVILESNDIQDVPSPDPRGYGIVVYSASGPGIQITNNIIAHSASTSNGATALNFDTTATGINATNNIIYQWKNAISSTPGANIISPNAINLTGYLDPNRTVETYDASVLGGPGTLADFVARASSQSASNWNPALTADAVNNYVRAGFTLVVMQVVASPASGVEFPGNTITLTLTFGQAVAVGASTVL